MYLIELLLDKSDYVFVSRDYCEFLNYKNKEEAVTGLALRVRPG